MHSVYLYACVVCVSEKGVLGQYCIFAWVRVTIQVFSVRKYVAMQKDTNQFADV